MNPKEDLEIIQMVYDHLADDESREIFARRLFYNLSGNETFDGNDESYLIPIYRKLIDSNGILQTAQEFEGKKIIFGSGLWGKRLLKWLPELDVACFVDNSPQGEYIDGIPVFSFDDILQKYDGETIIVSSTRYYEEMYKQLLDAGINERKIWVLGKEISVRQSEAIRRTYFDLPDLPHVSQEVFIDAGGYDGMTSRFFCKWCHGDYAGIHVFEPNREMRNICQKTLNEVPKCKIHTEALWNHSGLIRFYEDERHQMKLIDLDKDDIIGASDIPVVALDQMLKHERVTFIKMDIEGAEKEALEGAEQIIRKQKPKLAISAYHKKNDLWELPRKILSCRSDYRFYLRHYTFTRYETVLYGV